MNRIIIEALPPDQMRLEAYREAGCGDWHWGPEGDLHIQVACDGDRNIWDDEESFLIAIHECIEARLCYKAGITQGAVDAFDAAFTGEGEPGDEPDAPYRKEHRASMLVEHTIALLMGKFDYGVME
jgi:hypothetical protein